MSRAPTTHTLRMRILGFDPEISRLDTLPRDGRGTGQQGLPTDRPRHTVVPADERNRQVNWPFWLTSQNQKAGLYGGPRTGFIGQCCVTSVAAWVPALGV